MLKDILRLEKKVNLLNDKLDLLLEAQGVALKKSPEEVDMEEEKKRKNLFKIVLPLVVPCR